jgi:hypothetical protein
MTMNGQWVKSAVIAIVLTLAATGCSPSAASVLPTQPPPTQALEVLASKVEDVVGVWQGRTCLGHKTHTEYTKEGTFCVTVVSGDAKGMRSDQGKFWFEGTQFKIETEGGSCLTAQGEMITCIGTYQVYVTKQGDKPVKLRFVAVDDQYAARRSTTHNRTFPPVEP